MKNLKTYIELRYITESIKPPRLSAKNRDLWAPKPLDEKEVMKWLEKNCDIEGKVEIVDGKINVRGDIGIMDDVEFFPYPFGEVTGNFSCTSCDLISLKNSPHKVDGFFSCSYCRKLTSLKNCPEIVGGYFNCSKCNNLTYLEGAPKKVIGDFYCFECGKQFTKKDVKKVCVVIGNILA